MCAQPLLDQHLIALLIPRIGCDRIRHLDEPAIEAFRVLVLEKPRDIALDFRRGEFAQGRLEVAVQHDHVAGELAVDDVPFLFDVLPHFRAGLGVLCECDGA